MPSSAPTWEETQDDAGQPAPRELPIPTSGEELAQQRFQGQQQIRQTFPDYNAEGKVTPAFEGIPFPELLPKGGISVRDIIKSHGSMPMGIGLGTYEQSMGVPTEERIKQLEKNPVLQAEAGVTQGVAELGAGVGQFATSPSGALQLASLATPLAPLTMAKFAYDMAKGAKEAAEEAGTKFGEGDIRGGLAAVTKAIGLAAGAKGSGGHLTSKLVRRGVGIETPDAAHGGPIPAEAPKSEVPLTEAKAPEVTAEEARLDAGRAEKGNPSPDTFAEFNKPVDITLENIVAKPEPTFEIEGEKKQIGFVTTRALISELRKNPSEWKSILNKWHEADLKWQQEAQAAMDRSMKSRNFTDEDQFAIGKSQYLREPFQEVAGNAERLGFSPEIGREAYRLFEKSKKHTAELKESSANAPKVSPSAAAGDLLTPVSEGTTPADAPVETPPTASDWTSATEEVPSKATESGLQEYAGAQPTELSAGISIPKFSNRKMSVLDRITTAWSGKLQKSFGEARRAQKEIKAEVPKESRQAAISVWREANGDAAILKGWEANAKQKWMKDAARDAQTLTPREIAVAQKAIAAFSVLERRGNTFDVLKSHRDNYVPHVWDVKKPGTGFGGAMLKQRFRFSKARTLNTFFDGDQAGFKPKALAIGKLLPAYIHEMNSVISDRQFVRDIVKGTAKDGSPLAVPTGNVKVVDGPKGQAVLVQPKSSRTVDTSDYKVMSDQPALSNWTWEGKDTDGKPVFVKADLALHPDAYRRIHSALGQSAIRQWYRDPVSGVAQVPRAIARGLDTAQSAMKREMFGLLAPFHQVQEGTHAVGHLVNPFFGLEKIDPSKNPAQADAANHGLMLLPDRASSATYIEGSGARSSLTSQGIRKIPKVGEFIADVIDGYQDYLFHQYIPALKYKTYEAILGRNMNLYADELKSGTMTPSDVKLTSAEQSNAAYGHLNYALLDRNPTIKHLVQIGALAPDFLEARGRFVGQAVKGLSSPVGHEQLKAVAIIAAAQAGTAVILSSMLGVPYDPKHPFEVIYKGRRYAMRSVPEDIYGLLKDTRQFAYSRVNPLVVKGGVQLATGLNYRGEKVGPIDTMTELLAGYIPITARSIPGIRSLTETGRNNPVTPLQQLAGSLGLRVSRYSPVSETYKKAGEWMDAQKLPRDTGSYPVSKYQQLRYALEDGDMERAASAYAELKKTMTPGKISSGFKESMHHPFTHSQDMDKKFSASLSGYDKELYEQALQTRKHIMQGFYAMPKQ